MADDFRSFMSNDGRVITAKLIKVDARSGKVTLERENRKRATVPTDIFSEEDQDYIKDWVMAQNFLSNSKLRVSVDKRKEKAEEGRDSKNKALPSCMYEIRLQNRSSASFDKVNVECCIYKVTKRFKGEKREVVEALHKKRKPLDLRAGSDVVWKTDKVELYRKFERQTDYYTDEYGVNRPEYSLNKVSEDDVEGIWVKISCTTAQGNTFTRDVFEPERIEKRFSWNSSHPR